MTDDQLNKLERYTKDIRLWLLDRALIKDQFITPELIGDLITDSRCDKDKLKKITEVLSEFGCYGPCEHGTCCIEKECEECKLDMDTWCMGCRITVSVNS